MLIQGIGQSSIFSTGGKLLFWVWIVKFLTLNGFMNFASVYWHILGCLDSESNLVAVDGHHHYADVVADDDCFSFLAA